MTTQPSHHYRTLLVPLLGLLALGGLSAGPASSEDGLISTGSPQGTALFERDTLTGDWGGFRTSLEDRGVAIEMFYSGYFQGLSGSDAPDGFDWGHRFDSLIDFDFGKLGLWNGGSFHTHLTYRTGADGYRGGGLWPVSSALELPQVDSDEFEASSLYFRQQIGNSTTIMLGKMNAIDFLSADPHFGGWGVTRFMNLSAMIPPSGVFPPVVMGGQIVQRAGDFNFGLLVYDSEDRSGDYFPGDLFDEGVNFNFTGTWSGTLWGRRTSVSLNGAYSTKTLTDLNDVLLAPNPEFQEASTKDGAWAAAIQVTHLLVPSRVKPDTGLWVYAKALKGDGNPNYVEGYLTGGVSGHGLVPGRPDDYFGLAGFYFSFSNELRSSISPVFDIDDEKGVEAYYMASLAPWLKAGIDLQWVDPGSGANSDFLTLAFRTVVTF